MLTEKEYNPTCLFSNLNTNEQSGRIVKTSKCTFAKNVTKDRIICDTHMQMFNLDLVDETVQVRDDHSLLHFKNLVYNRAPEKFFPFPFKYDRTTESFCLDTSSLLKIITTNDATSEYRNYLEALLTEGIMRFYSNESVDVQLYTRMLDYTKARRELLKARHSSSYLTVWDVSDTGEVIAERISMDKFPIFYQILFYYAKISDTCEDNKTISSIPANLVCDIKHQYFRVINRPEYLKAPGTTFATSVVLLGSRDNTSTGLHTYKLPFPPVCGKPITQS